MNEPESAKIFLNEPKFLWMSQNFSELAKISWISQNLPNCMLGKVALADSTFWLIQKIAESATLWLIQIWLIQKIAESGIFWLIQIWLIQKIAESAIFWLIQIWIIQGNSWMSQILANSADSGLIRKFLAHSGFTDIL